MVATLGAHQKDGIDNPYHYWEWHPFLFKISAILERIGKGGHLFRIDQDF